MPIQVTGAGAPSIPTGDETPPNTPKVAVAMAFARVNARARIGPANMRPGRGRAPKKDPVYIELHDVEPAAKVEIINLSRNPRASFKSDKDVQELTITGRDLGERQAAIYLSDEQMQELDLKAGDRFALRLVDGAGNPSDQVLSQIDHQKWAGRDEFVFVGRQRLGRGSRLNLLDGESQRKPVVGVTVGDGRGAVVFDDDLSLRCDVRALPPVLASACMTLSQRFDELKRAAGNPQKLEPKHLEKLCDDERTPLLVRQAAGALVKVGLQLEVVNDAGTITAESLAAVARRKSKVSLRGPKVAELNVTFNVENQRTGERFEGTTGTSGSIELPMIGVMDGDRLMVRSYDSNGHNGPPIEMVFSSSAEHGRAPVVDSILGARLPGVI